MTTKVASPVIRSTMITAVLIALFSAGLIAEVDSQLQIDVNRQALMGSSQMFGFIGNFGYDMQRACLLYVENYRPLSMFYYTFDARSETCRAAIGIGAVSIIAAGIIFFISLARFLVAKLPFPAIASLILVALSGLVGAATLIVSFIATLGMTNSCNQFYRNMNGFNCETVFARGFYNEKYLSPGKSFALACFGIACGYAAAIGWIAMTLSLFMDYRKARVTPAPAPKK